MRPLQIHIASILIVGIATDALGAEIESVCSNCCLAALHDNCCVVGRSVEGRPILARVLGVGPDTFLFLASIHGNEPAGAPLLKWLGDHLVENPELLVGRRVVLVPVANPDGLAADTRYNARGVDLNRNFPAANRVDSRRSGTALSEPESRCLARVIEHYRPNRAVSIHQPLSCVDYDGPALELARVMAESSRLPVKRLGSRPGSLGSFLGVDHGIPIITLELPRKAPAQTKAVLWREYKEALVAAVTFRHAELAESAPDGGTRCMMTTPCACKPSACHVRRPSACTGRSRRGHDRCCLGEVLIKIR
jgi:protein MpaA